uniref:putative uncharacterized protein ZNRD1-AS1 n=1 Tax=Jaculus jaculus TaxID=51337 RepID=UPI0003331EF8|nr:putative uncharacterized protein ZNRD1-AS1 [Jaculus jaculus]
MLYMLIETQRAWLEKLQKEELKKLESRISSEDLETEPSGTGVTGQPLTKDPVSPLWQSQIQDSEWFELSPQEKLAWVNASKDPRIDVGQQSPLEKRIVNLGGVHTTAARHLVIQKYHEEYKTLCREQALSLDYWLAKAESYYNKRTVEMMKKEEIGNEVKMKMEEKTTQSIKGQKQYYWVPEREKKQIEKHVHRTGRVREFRNKTCRLPRVPSETTLPKVVPEEHDVQRAQRRNQVNEREQLQIEDHHERMIRGRKLTEQRLKDRILRKSLSQLPPLEKRERLKKETKEFERVVAYPLFQPCGTSQIKVNVLMEKSQNGKEVITVIKPYQRRFLTVPPFLRNQIRKIKD